jgi:hypothetical protein
MTMEFWGCQKRENPPVEGGFRIPGAVRELGKLYAPTVTVSSGLGRKYYRDGKIAQVFD